MSGAGERGVNGRAAWDGAPFRVIEPADQRLPFVFNSPHSGRRYPADFLRRSRLGHVTVRRSEDAFVEELFSGVVRLGAPLLAADFPRAYLDVNREPYELDQRMFTGPLPGHANTRSIRVAGGLGTIPRVVAEGQEIYAERLSVAEGMARIETIYRPYHAALGRLMARTSVRFGYAVLVDCHSMPSNTAGGSGNRPDVVVGDRYGTACAPGLTRRMMDAFATRGYRVTRNKPYAGGFITEHYGRPARGLHAIQIEINRGLYMDEGRIEPSRRFDAVARDLTAIVEEVASAPDANLYPPGRADEVEVDQAAE